MNEVKRFLLPIGIAVVALCAGLAIGRQTASKTSTPVAQPALASLPSSTPIVAHTPIPKETPAPVVQTDTSEPDVADISSGDIISRIKAALARPNGRKTY